MKKLENVSLYSNIRSEFEIKRYQPGYYNFYLFDEITKEKFVMHDADKYNEENEK